MYKVDMGAEMKVSGSKMEMVAKAKETLEQGGRGAHRFPKTLELAFNEYHRNNTLKHLRVALLTGLFLFMVFGIVDLMLLPADRKHMWIIRYVVVCPTIAAGLAFTFALRFRRFIQPVISFAMLVASLGIVAMVYFDPTPAKNYYYSGILLLIMGAFTFISLRFLYAVSWALATTFAYGAVAIFVNHTDSNILAQNIFNIIATIIIGAFSNYLMENYQRRDFLNALLLEYENRQLQTASNELRRLSISDALTTLGNRRHFDLMLDQEWMRSMRSASPISLIMLDIDYFKNYNDNYGHQAGDECIRLVAQKVRGAAKRTGDTSARYGGEEFALLLSGTELADAVIIAEVCRASVESLNIPHGYSMVCDVVMISAGVATMIPNSKTSSKALVEAADKELYRAKAEGRNRVVLESTLNQSIQLSAVTRP